MVAMSSYLQMHKGLFVENVSEVCEECEEVEII
jgi:hypothetical protein